MRADLLDILACPECLAPVKEGQTNLICTGCGREYSMEGSVPIMLNEEAKRQVHRALEDTESGVSMKRQFTDEHSKRERLRRLLRPPQHWYDIDKGKIISQVLRAGRVLEIGSGVKRLGPRVIKWISTPLPTWMW